MLLACPTRRYRDARSVAIRLPHLYVTLFLDGPSTHQHTDASSAFLFDEHRDSRFLEGTLCRRPPWA